MSRRRLSDLQVFPVGIGLAGVDAGDPDQGIATVHAALDAGVDVVDTAPADAPAALVEHHERLIGAALASWESERSQASPVLVTKGPASQAAITAAARRLGVAAIDVYLLPVDAPFADLAAHRERLPVRGFGVVAAQPAAVAAAVDAFGGPGDGGIVAVQPAPAEQPGLDPGLVAACADLQMAVLAWSPLSDPARGHEPPAPFASFSVLAEARGVSVAQLALAWLLALDRGVIAIAGAGHPATAQAAVHAADLVLSGDELAELTGAVTENIANRRG